MLSDADRTTTLLCEILSRHLAGQKIGPDDDFYAMGGDSLIALRVVADAQEQGLAITLRDILYHPTPRALGSHLAEVADEPVAEALPAVELTQADLALVPSGVAEVLPASALQVAMIYLCDTSGDPDLYHSAIGWEVAGGFDEPRFRRALAGLCDRHAALRSSFDLGTYSVPAQLVWSSVAPPLTVGPREEPARPLDWRAASLFRCYVEVGANSFKVTLVVHHAIIDGWSLGRLVVDLLSLYEGVALPALPEGIGRAFIEAEHEQVASAEAAEYWRRQASPLVLFAGRDRFSGAADARDSVEFPLSDELVRRLQAAAKQLRIPLKCLTLAAHARAFAELTGQREVVTGLVVNTRPQVAGADLVVGLYLNTVPVRVSVSGTWSELATAALVAERSGSRYRGYPLAHIESKLGRPAFDATFNFTNFHVYQDLDRLTGLEVGSWWVRGKPSFPFRVDFELAGIEAGNRVVVAFDPDLLPPADARRYADLFEQTLTAAAEFPLAAVRS